MLIFFDESFRQSRSPHKRSFGVLAGVAIPEKEMHRVSTDIFQLKLKHFGQEFASEKEIKGKDLLKNRVFQHLEKGNKTANLNFTEDLLQYIKYKKIYVFGCVCFEKDIQRFKCNDVKVLDNTFRYIFERVDMFMKIEHQNQLAKLVFDDRDYGTNHPNAAAITNFFTRSPRGLALNSILKTPFFAISQAQNIGLQLADFVTTIIGLRFESCVHIRPYYELLKPCIYSYMLEGKRITGLKLIKGIPKE
ncbi:MAG TPA: DUF3800 domain-containing protein [Verrucomicrobiae bacterium]|jgi:hypothetical protein